MAQLEFVCAKGSGEIRERGRQFNVGQAVSGVVEIRARDAVVVQIRVVRRDREQWLKAKVKSPVVVVGGQPFLAIVLIRVEAPVHVGILTVKQRRGKAANQENLLQRVEREVADGVGLRQSGVIFLLRAVGPHGVVEVEEVPERGDVLNGEAREAGEVRRVRGVEIQLGGLVGETKAEFGQGVIIRRRKDSEEPAVGAVVADQATTKGARQVAPVGRAGLRCGGDPHRFLHTAHRRRPRLLRAGTGRGGGILGFQAEEEADGDHRREHDEDQNRDEDEAPAVARLGWPASRCEASSRATPVAARPEPPGLV